MIVLLSAAAVASGAIQAEIEVAGGQRRRTGRPVYLPIRLPSADELPYAFMIHLQQTQMDHWHSDADDSPLIDRLLAAAGYVTNVHVPRADIPEPIALSYHRLIRDFVEYYLGTPEAPGAILRAFT
jgi:hypothetical protein